MNGIVVCLKQEFEKLKRVVGKHRQLCLGKGDGILLAALHGNRTLEHY